MAKTYFRRIRRKKECVIEIKRAMNIKKEQKGEEVKHT